MAALDGKTLARRLERPQPATFNFPEGEIRLLHDSQRLDTSSKYSAAQNYNSFALMGAMSNNSTNPNSSRVGGNSYSRVMDGRTGTSNNVGTKPLTSMTQRKHRRVTSQGGSRNLHSS